MALFFDSDTDAFFPDFAEDVVYAVPPAQGVTIKGIFDNKGQNVTVFEEEIQASGPQVTVKSSDVAGVKNGNTTTIRGKTWYIRDVEDDGTGITVLTLSEN